MANLKALLTKDVGGLPVAAWGGIVIVGAGIGIFILKKTQASSAASSPTGASSLTGNASVPGSIAAGAAGAPNTYQAAQPSTTPATPYPTIPQGQIPILPPGVMPIYDGNGNLIGYSEGGTPTPVASPSPTPPTMPNPNPPTNPLPTPAQSATIRPQMTQPGGINYAWDQSHTGVPIRSSPGMYGPVASYANFGASIPVLGPAINGPVNEAGGSGLWYPVSGGYLSAGDILGVGGGYRSAKKRRQGG